MSGSSMGYRVRAGAALLTTLLLAFSTALIATLPARAESVTFITDFGFNGRHAYYYVALDRGYYRDAGLDVTLVRGSGSADAIRKVGAGAAQIGFADAGSLVLARANDGLPVRMIAVVYAAPPQAIYTTQDSGIRKPQDLAGHRIADSAGSANTLLFGAYAKAAGIDAAKVTWQLADGGALPALLATGRAEAVGQFTVGEPLLAAAVAPKKLVRFAYRDVGLDYYGNGIIASEELIAREPDMLRRFVAATVRGMRDAFADPAMAGETIARYQKQIKPEIGAAEIEQVRDLADVPGQKLGAIEPSRIAATVKVIAAAFTLNRPAVPDELWAAGFTP
jgi:NitT/TauT family transport system substrate-binding protein